MLIERFTLIFLFLCLMLFLQFMDDQDRVIKFQFSFKPFSIRVRFPRKCSIVQEQMVREVPCEPP